jgi:hypothetical protein
LYTLAGSSEGAYLSLFLTDPSFAAACPLGSMCNVALAVTGGVTDTQYQITCATAGSTTVLGEGQELSRITAANATSFFVYSPPFNGTITFAVTPLSGIPLIAASVTNPNPTPGSAGWAPARIPGARIPQVIEINMTDNSAGNQPCAPACSTYYVSVTAANNEAAAFTIVASTTPSGSPPFLQLTDGVQAPGVAPPHLMTYFTFNISLPLAPLDVYVATLSGSAEVFVALPPPGVTGAAAFPSPYCYQTSISGACTYWGAASGSYNWTSVGSTTTGLASVPALSVPVGTTLTIAVLATTPDNTDGTPPPPSNVLVTAATGAAPIILSDGVSVSASVLSNVARYFSFTPLIYNADIVLSADVFDGRVAVYASEAFGSEDPNTFPGPAQPAFPGQPAGSNMSMWNATDSTTGAERNKALYIPFSSLSPRCAFAVRVNSGACTIALAVLGSPRLAPYARATFTAMAASAGSPLAPMQLNDGGSVYTVLSQGGCQYFLAQVSGAGNPTAFINVQNIVGASSLYTNYQSGNFWVPGSGAQPDFSSADVGGFERARIVTNSTANLYVTVCADVPATVGPTSILVDFHTGARIVELANGIPYAGSLFRAAEVAYFSFTVTRPLSDVLLGLDRTFGGVDMWIAVENPMYPWLLPGPTYYTWTWSPNLYSPFYNISHTDPKACVPTPLIPCVYNIALTARFNASAAFIITASDHVMPIPILYNGEPVTNSVADGAYNYYVFQPSGAGVPTPGVILQWTNFIGNVAAYVTNSWVPGVSSPSDLPGPFSTSMCQWVCTNFTGCFMFPGDPCYLPASASGGPVVYTIAITGATNDPGFMSSYQLAAVVSGSPQLLQLGTPTSDIFLPARTNVTFGFVLEQLADVSVVASVAHGSVTMMVAHDATVGGSAPPPGCTPPASGSLTVCSGYTWLVSTGLGEPALYINASNPCSAVVPPGTALPVVDPGCASNTRAFTPGRYWVTLYSNSDLSEMSLLVNAMYRPIPTVPLADGSPQVSQSSPLTICPGASRDPSTGACNPDPVNPTFIASGSLFVFRIPGNALLPSASVMVERLCNGNYSGDCGAPLSMYLKGCQDSQCAESDLVPYHLDNILATRVFDTVGSFDIPDALCVNSSSSSSGQTPDCFYSIGVYPTADGGPWPPPPGPPVPRPLPGVNMPPSLYRVTLSTAQGIQRIPADCPGFGRVCSLPPQSVSTGTVRRYEGYADPVNGVSPTPVTIVGSLCYGQSLTLSACYLGGSCYSPNNPGGVPNNADATATSGALGVSTLAFSNPVSSRGVYWLGVSATGGASPSAVVPPVYSLSMQHDIGWTLAIDPLAPGITTSWVTPTSLSVSWGQPVLLNSEAIPASIPAAGAFYIINVFPFGATGQWVLSTPCGAEGAAIQGNLSVARSFARNALSTTITGLPQGSYTYMVTVTAICDARDCLPIKDGSFQRVAFAPAATDVIPTPTPPPTPLSSTPSPSASPAPAAVAKASLAGPIVGAVFGLLAAGGAFFLYRKYGSSLYSFAAVPGGSMAEEARSSLSAHPIFGGASPSLQEEVSADYSSL